MRKQLWTPEQVSDMTARYLAGESPTAIGRDYGVSRTGIGRVLRDAGVARRSNAEANRLLAEARTPEERREFAAAAHEAVRGRKVGADELARRAITRQARGHGISDSERLLGEWLSQRGVATIAQQAVLGFNIDLGAEPVAIEVFGGDWHASGRHAERFERRTRALNAAGWQVAVIWVTRSTPLTEAVADALATHVREVQRQGWSVPVVCMQTDGPRGASVVNGLPQR